MIDFISLEGSWTDYLGQIGQAIDTLEEISAWDSKEKITLENIIHLCKDNIEGVTYRDQFDNNISKTWSLSPEYETLLREKLQNAVDRLQQLNPDYVKPSIEVKKPDACFIVTATMNDPCHPTVLVMREFRDHLLMQSPFGRAFIDWYYKNGPTAAKHIHRSKSLRLVSYVFLVIPASLFAKFLLKATKRI